MLGRQRQSWASTVHMSVLFVAFAHSPRCKVDEPERERVILAGRFHSFAIFSSSAPIFSHLRICFVREHRGLAWQALLSDFLKVT